MCVYIGGDVRNLIQITENSKSKANEFFQVEYGVNYMIHQLQIPYLSLWDGIVMGGGIGISVYGKFRIATENTLVSTCIVNMIQITTD